MRRLFNGEQTAGVLGLHRSRIYEAIASRKIIPDVQVGNSKAWFPESLPGIIDKLDLTAEEVARARENLRVNGIQAERLKRMVQYFYSIPLTDQ